MGLLTSPKEDTYYEYLKRQHRLATKMELNDDNVIAVLEELLPYIEADGGWLEYVETDYQVVVISFAKGFVIGAILL